MAVHFVGSTRQTLQFGRAEFWAESGLIHFVEQDTGGYDCMSVKTFLERLQGLNDMLGRKGDGETGADRHLRGLTQAQVEQGIALVAKAQQQGTPDDPTARAALQAARPKTFVMSHAPL